MAQISITDLMRMMQQNMGQVSNTEADAMKAALAGAAIKGMPKFPVSMEEEIEKMRATAPSGMGNGSDMEMQRLVQAMAANPEQAMRAPSALSLPANEMQPNYADGQAPIAIGGGLLADEAQMLMNTAYDMSAPREMRINAINRLRELGY